MSICSAGPLFDPQPVTPAAPALAPTDPNVRRGDVRRITGQNLAILERLRRGPARNSELAILSLKYTSRISDLRAAGYAITESAGLYTLST